MSTPLPVKLGLRPGLRVYVDGGPEHLEDLLGGAAYTTRLPRETDLVLLFATTRARLDARLPRALERTRRDGAVWVCWPKKASGVRTDLGDAEVRETGLATGWVDVKVAAIDETWSGLKFVRRLADR